jgi:hypothetical protein
MKPGRSHVADRLIAEDRDPTPAETAHIDTCPECFAIARRRLPFDMRLAGAAHDLVSEPLPREVLLVDAPNAGSGRWWMVGGVAIGLALVAVFGLSGLMLLEGRPSPGAGSDQAPAPVPRDPGAHVVELPGDDVAIELAGEDAIVVSRLSAGGPEVLAKVPVPRGDVAGFAMLCFSPDGTAQPYVFGRLDPADGPPIYKGPTAIGHGASDGLFLFAITPGTIVSDMVWVTTASGGIRFGQDAFDQLAKQPGPLGSPCRL